MTAQQVARADALAEATLPRSNGEVVFDQPWNARAMAMAVLLVERTGLPWDDFRRCLIDAVGDVPGRPYWESWVIALESFVSGI